MNKNGCTCWTCRPTPESSLGLSPYVQYQKPITEEEALHARQKLREIAAKYRALG